MKKYSKIEITGPKLPKKLAIGLSLGVDSISALDFLANHHYIDVVFIDHVTDGLSHLSDKAREVAKKYDANFIFHRLEGPYPGDDISHESWWRHGRYDFFHSLNMPVVTAHHLDDCVETWIWSCMRGVPSIIPYKHKNVIRPFRSCRKDAFRRWAIRNNLEWHEDESNEDERFTRNFIRNNMVKDALVVNPGLYKTVRRKVIADVSVSQNADDRV